MIGRADSEAASERGPRGVLLQSNKRVLLSAEIVA